MTALVKTGVAIKGAFEKKGFKNITKEIKPSLKDIAKKKGLKKEDIILIKKINEKYILNSQAKKELLKKNLIKRPKDGKCLFIDGNNTYVAKSNETGHYLYCSRNPATEEAFYLDVIDIFYILSTKSYGDIETELLKTFGIHTKEEEVKEYFRVNYLSNIEKIEDIDSWRYDYPNLYNRVKNTLETYKILNIIGLENVIGINGYVDGNAAFFAGAKYISQRNQKSKSTTIGHLNMLALLGLVIKLEEDCIPGLLSNRAKVEAKEKKHPNIINFFIIPKLTPELFKRADEIALKAKENNLSLNNIGYKKIEEVFGEEMLYVVYGGKSRVKEIKRTMDLKNLGESEISREETKNKRMSKEKEIEIKFQVDSIIDSFPKNNYVIASATILEYPDDLTIPTANIIVSGHFPIINENDNFKAIGYLKDMGKLGSQFIASSTLLIKSESSKGFEQFLYKKIKGIGKTTANRLVEKFGEDIFEVVTDNPERLLEVKGIGIKKVMLISEELKKHTDYDEIRFKLMPLGIGSLEIAKLYDKYGNNVITKLKENPYIFSSDKLVSFKKVDLIAEKLEIPSNDRRRIREAIVQYISYNHTNKGNIFVNKDDLLKGLSVYLNKYGSYRVKLVLSIPEIEEAISYLIKNEIIAIEIYKNNNAYVYSKFYLDMENNIVKLLEKMLNHNSLETVSSIQIKDFLEKSNIPASNNQKQAIIMALSNKLSILNGGAGTGKSATAKFIVDTIKNFNPNAKIELAAPTGKAARKLSEYTGMEAKTIHRLIGLNGLGERAGPLKEVNADYLIIDEASMIDTYLFYSLLSVISNKTQVLIMGDYNQLPSIGPGAILRDLIESKLIPCIILEEVFRQGKGSRILENANKLVKGEKDLNLETSDEFKFIDVKNILDIQENIISSIKNLLKSGYKMNDIQVITPMNKGDIGALELNRLIQDKFNPKRTYKPEIKVADKVFRVGDKVMQTVNNYELNVFNGETGRIVKITNDSSINKVVVKFKDRMVMYTGSSISQLVLAYAITVHKAQGGEFKTIIMPIHSSQSIILSRNLVYTAWTRAKEKLVCIGDTEELYRSINKVDIVERNSQLKDKLIEIRKKLIDIPF